MHPLTYSILLLPVPTIMAMQILPRGTDIPLVPIQNFQGQRSWAIEASVGTPPQPLHITLGLETSDISLSGSPLCGGNVIFDGSKSSTFQSNETESRGVAWVNTDDVTAFFPLGYISTDTFNIHGLEIPNQKFFLEHNCTRAQQVEGTSEGRFSISLTPPVANESIQSPFWSLYAAGKLESSLFSFSLKEDDAIATLGGADPSKFSGEIQWASVDNYDNWYVYVPAVYLNGGQQAVHNVTPPAGADPYYYGLLDTWSNRVYAPTFEVLTSIYGQISPDIHRIGNSGVWGAPCDILDRVATDITLTIGTTLLTNVTIPKARFNLGPISGQPGICEAVIRNMNPHWDDIAFWTLGQGFLENYYTVWDAMEKRVGFANLAS